ncbi:MAG: SIR2 family protein [Promethearchaeota archaeon]
MRKNSNNKEEKFIRKTIEEKEISISYIADEIIKKRLTIFVGAGCSISAGLPSWGDLINEIREESKIKTFEKDLLIIASLLEKKIGYLPFREKIISRLKKLPSSTVLHKTLVKLDVDLFVTTNYDHLLEEAFRDEGIIPGVIIHDKDIPTIDPTDKTIVKLHGDIDSATSIIISSIDYNKYALQHSSFIDWLNSKVVQNTIFFIGTSFTDQRLKDADNYVLKRFGKFRRPPCVILKMPTYEEDISEEDYENYKVEFEDFEILYEEFKSKKFHIIVVKNYEEICEVLEKINDLVLKKQLQENPEDFHAQFTLKSIHAEHLQKELYKECDEKIKNLCNKIWGYGQLPTKEIIKKNVVELVNYLNEKQDILNDESKLEGFLTLIDAFLNLGKKKYINEAQKYFNKTNMIYQKMKQKSKLKERMSRISAKLYFFQGKVDEAIEIVSNSKNEKTISIWLALLIDSKKFDEAYRFISSNETKVTWLAEALYILIIEGHIDEAEEKYQEFAIDFQEKIQSGTLNNSPYKNKYYHEKVCAQIADAFFRRAIKSAAKNKNDIYVPELNIEGKNLCKKAVEYVDKISIELSGKEIINNLKRSYFAYRALLVKMQALYFLEEFRDADEIAEKLISVIPLAPEIAEYVRTRVGSIQKNTIIKVIEALSRDYTEQTWALLLISTLKINGLKDYNSAWEYALKVLKYSSQKEEKESAAGNIFDIGFRIKKIAESRKIINEYLPSDSLWKKYLEAVYQYSIANTVEASKMFIDIENENPPSQIKALCLYMRALLEIEQDNYQKAQLLLEESNKIFFGYPSLQKLLEVQVKLQDDLAIIKTAEKLEKYDSNDEEVIHIKAQAAKNIGYFEMSEQAFKSLIDKHPDNSELTFEYAQILVLQDKYPEALEKLAPFINCDQDMNPKCLMLAAEIHCILEEEMRAFDILEKCWNHFKDVPELLTRHVDLGFRIGEEEKANRSLVQLEQLRQEGKVPEQIFDIKKIDDIKEFIKKRKETIEELLKKYQSGQIPRHFLCSYYNLPLYIDWAYRTQPLEIELLSTEQAKIEFTTYVTNGFKIKFVKRNQLMFMTFPEDVEEIIIDYTALITLHRLGLLDKLALRFKTIYYPKILETIWLLDSGKYKYHQASQEKVYRSLSKKFDLNSSIKVIESLLSHERKHRNLTERCISLAQTENIPMISAYLEKKEIPKNSSLIVLRFSQLLAHLYRKGRISEKRYIELKQLIRDKGDIIKKGVSKILDNASRLLFDEITLELAEQNELLDDINNSGFQIVVEKDTCQNIRSAVRSIEFSKDVGEWQKDLKYRVKNIEVPNKEKLFKALPVIPFKNRNFHYYNELLIETLQNAENKKLPILTDDRCIQAIKTSNFADKQFSSDLLISDLYNKKIISLKEYADSFLKMCEWRYRFLVPKVEVITYFLEQYKNNPLGKPIETLIKYCNECMEDKGLLLGWEATEPPTICGVKYYLKWMDVWIEALIQIWTNSGFISKEEITQQIILRAFPKGPEGLNPDIRKNVIAMNERFIVNKLFLGTMNYAKPEIFQKLFKIIFDSLGFDYDKRINELIFYLKSVKRNTEKLRKKDKNNKVGRLIAIRALKAFYGESFLKNEGRIVEELIPILIEIGVKIEKKRFQDHITMSKDEEQKILDLFLEKPDTERQNITEYSPGPIIFIPSSKEKGGEFTLCHDAIMSDSLEIRKGLINKLLQADYISEYTKAFIRARKNEVLSDKHFIWQTPTKELHNTLLGDFLYIQDWFRQLGKAPISDKNKQEFLNIAINRALEPNLKTIYSNLPLLLEDPFKMKDIEARIKKELEKLNSLDEFLDWYLENVYFIPYVADNEVYSMFKDIKMKKSNILTKRNIKRYNLEIIKKWLNKVKEDHFARLLILELVLGMRSEIKGIEEKFTDADFYEFLDSNFKILLSSSEAQDKSSNSEIVFMRLIWKLRVELARYYFRYIDLNSQKDFDDERKIVIAWWMAKKTTYSILEIVKKENLTIEDKSNYLKGILDSLIEKFEIIRLRHYFYDINNPFSSSRYLMFNTVDLLSYATIALFSIRKRNKNNILKGLMHPAKALSEEIRNMIIEKLINDILLGNGQLSVSSETLQLLWNNSLCDTVPILLEEYYGDALSYLGQKINNKIEKAKEINSLAFSVSAKKYLNQELPNLPKYINTNNQSDCLLVINSLKVFMLSHKESEFPDGLKIFKKDNSILEKLCQFENPWAYYSCLAFSQILLSLQSRRCKPWLVSFYEQFKKIKYQSCDVETTNLIAEYLIIAVLIGGDYDILDPLLSLKHKDRKIRDLLRKKRQGLEYIFPFVPSGSRDNLRKLLNDLFNI